MDFPPKEKNPKEDFLSEIISENYPIFIPYDDSSNNIFRSNENISIGFSDNRDNFINRAESNNIVMNKPQNENPIREEKDKKKNDNKNYIKTFSENKQANFRDSKVQFTSHSVDLESKNNFSEIYRQDKYIKAFKSRLVRFLTNKINDLLKKSKLGGHIFLPNSLFFTSKANLDENKKFLNFSVKEIFCYFNAKKCHYNEIPTRQNKNKDKIEKILSKEYLMDEKNKEIIHEIKSFLLMKFEDAVKIFYESQDFKGFISERKIQFFDESFKKEKNFSLLEKDGFVRFFRTNSGYHKKGKISFNTYYTEP